MGTTEKATSICEAYMWDLALIGNLTLARAAQNIIDDIFNHPASTKYACAVQSLRIRFLARLIINSDTANLLPISNLL